MADMGDNSGRRRSRAGMGPATGCRRCQPTPPPPHFATGAADGGQGEVLALRAYCAHRGWDTHPSNTVGGDRIISSESISEK